ncbi:MAG: hypothetical protein ACRDPF_12435, partial [Streptosporangiaceae bacterium]
VHGYTMAFAVSAVLFGIGALAAVLLLPSRRRLEELRNPAPAASATTATSPSLTDTLSAADGARAADPR